METKGQRITNGFFTITWENEDTLKIVFLYGENDERVKYIDGGDFENLLGAIASTRDEI